MPGLDKTGPEGKGPMTGRRMGHCTNFGKALKNKDSNDSHEKDDLGEDGLRRRFGRGLGRGRGMGNRNRFHGGK
jgi:hypothetical protein